MKKLLVGVLVAVAALAYVVTAADLSFVGKTPVYSDLPTIRQAAQWNEINTNLMVQLKACQNAITNLENAVTSLVTQVNSTIWNNIASNRYAWESGSGTGTEVFTFSTPFKTAPKIFLGVTAYVGAENLSNAVPSSSNARTNFTTTLLGTTTLKWLALGER